MKKKSKIIIAVAALLFLGACLFIGQSAWSVHNVVMAQKALAAGDLAKSEAYYLKAIDINPRSVFARYYYYADFLQKLERYEDGIPHLKFIVNKKPKYWTGYYMLGAAYHMVGQYDEAWPYLQTAAEKSEGKNAADSLHRMAQIKSKQGKHDEAIELLEKAKGIEPLLPRVVHLLGAEYSIVGQDEKRHGLYRDYVRNHAQNYGNPNQHEIWIYLTFASGYLFSDPAKQEIDNVLFETRFKEINPLLYEFKNLIQAIRENEPYGQELLNEIRARVLAMPEEQRAIYEGVRMTDMLNELEKQIVINAIN